MRRKLHMPAITLGLAEVEERLHALRRRLNAVTAQHSVYVSLSVTIAVLTGLIILALRGWAAAFRGATWSGGILCLAVGVWGWLTARRRWLDVVATARLADRRGGLADRLLTLVDLRTRARPSRLAPVLVAQLLALSTQWQVQRIAPRRIPRSVLSLFASFLALGSTAFIERRPPPPPPVQTAAASARTAVTADALFAAARGGMQAANGPSVPGLPAAGDIPQASGVGASAAEGVLPGGKSSDGAESGAGQRGEGSQAPAAAPRPEGAAGGREELAPSANPLTALPDRLQDAIRRAFHAEAMDRPQELAARSDPTSRELATREGQPNEGQQGKEEGQRDGATDPSKRGMNGESSQKGAAAGQQQGAGKPKSGSQRGQRQDGNPANQNFEGNSPAAGEGSSPQGLLGDKALSAVGDAGATKTFKLTITSFLRAMEQKGNQPRPSGKKSGTGGSASPGNVAQVALSERQLNDDALRKAEIPPEYEDIVRRVYSLRAE